MNSEAIATMKRAGIDITSHTSDHVDQYLNEPIDIVISVCDNARDTCPDFPGQVRKICKTFPDPPAMAKSMNSQVEVEACYDQVRNEIERYVSEFLETLA
jgi:arsenate reductase